MPLGGEGCPAYPGMNLSPRSQAKRRRRNVASAESTIPDGDPLWKKITMSVRVRAPHKTNGAEAPSEAKEGGQDGLETQRREPTDRPRSRGGDIRGSLGLASGEICQAATLYLA